MIRCCKRLKSYEWAWAWPCSCGTKGCRRTHAHAPCLTYADTPIRAWACHPTVLQRGATNSSPPPKMATALWTPRDGEIRCGGGRRVPAFFKCSVTLGFAGVPLLREQCPRGRFQTFARLTQQRRTAIFRINPKFPACRGTNARAKMPGRMPLDALVGGAGQRHSLTVRVLFGASPRSACVESREEEPLALRANLESSFGPRSR